ncbi:hypothetical protein Pmani_026559 [Petrolisthes manimaculis]|uniref:Uncharacterized protein n=1 Tax=Petrolisthes manimaculis TaxID=1843537 RepID=A0AAE1P5U6_9EUCA|nr:hypothetical protein Pmani_026559 [Petrolisthes manimaculis]
MWMSVALRYSSWDSGGPERRRTVAVKPEDACTGWPLHGSGFKGPHPGSPSPEQLHTHSLMFSRSCAKSVNNRRDRKRQHNYKITTSTTLSQQQGKHDKNEVEQDQEKGKQGRSEEKIELNKNKIGCRGEHKEEKEEKEE